MKLKRNLKKIIYLSGMLLILGASLAGISELTRSKVRGEDVVYKYLHAPEDEIGDVLFLGTSRAYDSFSPMKMWEETGLTSYTLSTSRQPIPASYYLAKMAVQKRKPKMIVFEIYGVHYENTEAPEGYTHQALDLIPWTSGRLSMLADIYRDNLADCDLLEIAFPFIKYHSRWDELDRLSAHTENYYVKGYQVTHRTDPQPPFWTEQTEEIPLTDITVKYLDKLITLCEDNDIPLLFVRTPEGGDERLIEISKRENTALRYAEERGVPVLDMQPLVGELGLDSSTDFKDYLHLNTRGAEKVSVYMAHYLQENFGMADYSDDPKYQHWNKEAQQYEQRKEADLEKRGMASEEDDEEDDE